MVWCRAGVRARTVVGQNATEDECLPKPRGRQRVSKVEQASVAESEDGVHGTETCVSCVSSLSQSGHSQRRAGVDDSGLALSGAGR